MVGRTCFFIAEPSFLSNLSSSSESQGRGSGVGRGLGAGAILSGAQYLPPVFANSPPHTIIALPVQTPVGRSRPPGALAVLVTVQLLVLGLYLPPVLGKPPESSPPQTIISLPVQTAAWLSRASGALVVLVAVQLSVLGLYLPPVFR